MKNNGFSKWMIAFAIIVFCSFLWGACSSDDEAESVETPQDSNASDNNTEPVEELLKLPLAKEQRVLVESGNDFAFRLAQATMIKDKSQIISPLSVAYLTGMLANGVSEKTFNEIATTLGMSGKSLEEINSYFKMMLNDLPRLDLSTTLSQSNALFTNQGYTIFDDYKNAIRDFYSADTEILDFSQQSAIDRINNWLDEHTKGVIKNIMNSLDPKAAAYGLNAVYFKAGWIDKFKEEETKEEAFGKDGKRVPMMHLNTNLTYNANDMCQYIRMPYGNGAFEMVVILPNEGITTVDLMEKLNAETILEMRSGYISQVDVKMPRFETECKTNLVKVLTDIGMPSLFSLEERFEKMTTDNFSIGDIAQTASIKVNENGSEAAAVTHVYIAASENMLDIKPRTFHANRPFIYVIREQYYGIVMFIGHYEGD